MSRTSSPNKICLIGTNSLLAKQLEQLDFEVHQYGRSTPIKIDYLDNSFKGAIQDIAKSQYYNMYIILSGYLQPKKIEEQDPADISKSFLINTAGPVISSEIILSHDKNARIIIFGSESGRKGSYDLSYALSKSSLKVYVYNKRVLNNQQLLLLSPSTVGDMGMTKRRLDHSRLLMYKEKHPKKRFLTTSEIAVIIASIFASSLYITNTEIEVNGGKFANLFFE